METPHYMTEYWRQVIEEAECKIAYAREQLAKIAIKQTIENEEE